MQEIIKVLQLTKSYGRLPALNDVSFSVSRGTIFGLLGANGAGKSTAMECILGTRRADKGQISLLGMDPLTDRKKLFEQVGVQFQETNYQEQITVAELCEVTASLYKKSADPSKLLEAFGLADRLKSPVRNLSGGQRQRLYIVLALIPEPEVVFLDELTTGLDVKARREVWNILLNLKKQGLTIFLTSHFMDEVEALCDQICILKKGEAVFRGTVRDAVKNSPCDKFEDAYLWYSGEEEETDEGFSYNA